MSLQEELRCLGTDRVIWIDDHFNDTPRLVALMLVENLEISRDSGIAELEGLWDLAEIDQEQALPAIEEVLTAVGPERLNEIKSLFFREDSSRDIGATNELTPSAVEQACEILAIAEEDRWTFDEASSKLAALCGQGDDRVSYIVDLNDKRGLPDRGVEILRELHAAGSKGTAFVLTHEARVQNESAFEAELREKLAHPREGDVAVDIPVCVIAKERMAASPDAEEDMQGALKIAIKRAGLRRSVHEVLLCAKKDVSAAFQEAESLLLGVPPEQLDTYVVEKGYREGVSELHVIERALTAHISKKLRSFFGTSQEVQGSIDRVRSLRKVELNVAAGSADHALKSFHEAEVWESDALVNVSLSPIACGDVFDLDGIEPSMAGRTARFVLLAQPCDISLRPEADRTQKSGFFVPLRLKGEGAETKVKELPLQFRIDGQQWVCDFRKATMAQLAILDLASFRADGRVRVEEGASADPRLLPGQSRVFAARTKTALAEIAKGGGARALPDLKLTLDQDSPFNAVKVGKFYAKETLNADGHKTTLPVRVSWNLQRVGRIRMPYASDILETYTRLLSRHAFDINYTDEVSTAAA